MKKIILIVIFLCITSTCLFGASYYVKSGGNDNSAGTSDETAWANCPGMEGWAGSATLSSEDIVYFRSQDTWTGTGANAHVINGIAGVTYDGSTYGSGTRAKLTSEITNSYHDNAVFTVRVSGVTIRGFEIYSVPETGLDGISIGYQAGANISTFLIHNNIIHNADRYGIIISNSDGHATTDVTITNNTVYNCANATGINVYASWGSAGNINNTVLARGNIAYNNEIGMSIVNDSNNVTYDYNTIYDNDYGIIVRTSPDYEGGDQVYDGPSNFSIQNNLVYGNNLSGVLIYSPSDLTVTGVFYNNIFYSNGVASVDCSELTISSDGTEEFGVGSELSFYSNTFYSATKTCSGMNRLVNLGAWTDLVGATINFKNNILYAGDNPALYIDGTPTINHQNNLIFSSSNPSNLVRTENINYNLAAIKTWEATAQNTDPSFTGGTLPTAFTGTYGSNMIPNTTYFATTTGPTIDTGATLGSPYNGCINGAGLSVPLLRPGGAAYDIGAYEYQAVGLTPSITIGGGSIRGGSF